MILRDVVSRFGILSCATILLLTGAAKVYSGIGDGEVLRQIDPLFGISFRQLFIAVGLFEIAAALYCFLSKKRLIAAGVLVTIALEILVYRAGLAWIDYHKPCSCLGTFGDALGLTPAQADRAMLVAVLYILLCGLGAYAAQLGSRRPSTPTG